MELPDVTDKVRIATEQLVEEHVSELKSALAIQTGGIVRNVSRQLIEGICDKLADPQWKVEIRSIAQTPTAKNATDIDHMHVAVERLFSDVTQRITTSLQALATVTQVATESHFRTVSIPKLTGQYSTLLAEEQHRMADQMNRRVRYFSADHEAKMAMMANHEIKVLSPYLNTLLFASAGGGGSLGDLVSKKTTSTTEVEGGGEESSSYDVVLSLAKLENEIQALMKPSVLGKMSADRAKNMLLESLHREKSNWKEFERIQQILNHNARKEEEEREIFRTNLLDSVEKETTELKDAVNSISADFKQEEERKLMVEKQRDEVLEVLQAIDKWCVSLSAEVEFLLSVAKKNDAISVETERVEKYLGEVGDQYRAHNLAGPYQWLRDHIRTNPATIPNPTGNELATEMLQVQKRAVDAEKLQLRCEHECQRLADALNKETVKGIHAASVAKKERREYEEQLTQEKNKLLNSNRYLTVANQKLSLKLEHLEDPKTLYDVPALTQDLARKLGDAERRAKFGLGSSGVNLATYGASSSEEECSAGSPTTDDHHDFESSNLEDPHVDEPIPQSSPLVLLSTAAVKKHHQEPAPKEPMTKPPRPPPSSTGTLTPRNMTPEATSIVVEALLPSSALEGVASSPLASVGHAAPTATTHSSSSTTTASSVKKDVPAVSLAPVPVTLHSHWIEQTALQGAMPRPPSATAASLRTAHGVPVQTNPSNGGSSTWKRKEQQVTGSPRVYTLSDDPLLLSKPHSARPINPVRWQLKAAQQVIARSSRPSSAKSNSSAQRTGSPRTPRPPSGCLQK